MSENFETATPSRGRKPVLPLDRLPPHELDAEMAVIGCCLLDPKNAIVRCQEKLPDGPESFYDLRHQLIYRNLIGMTNLGEDVDPIALGSWMGGRFLEVGGHPYLGQCQDKVPSAANLDIYLDIIIEKSTLRKIISNCTRISSRAYEHSGNLDSLLVDLEKNVLEVSSSTQPKAASNGKVAGDFLADDLERRMNLNGALSGLDSGLSDLNKMTEGIQFGEQMVVGARPSMGKTALGLKMFVNQALYQKTPSLFISLEMTTAALMRRMLSMTASIPMQTLRRGSYSQSDFQKFIAFRSQCSKVPMYIVENVGGMSCREICAVIRRMSIKEGIKLVVIDYMQKIKHDVHHDMRTYEVADTSGKLKAVAAETGVAMVTLTQLNRDNTKDKGRAPRLSDLAESGQIERDADSVVLIHRDNDGSSLIVAKQRDGETGLVPVFFNGAYVRFENSSYADD